MAKTGAYTAVLDDNELALNYAKATNPTSMDRGVLNYRTWLRLFAGGRIPYQHDRVLPSVNSDIVFDVWNAHTKSCSVCQEAVGNLKKARFATFFVATCLGVLRPASSDFWNLADVLLLAGAGLLMTLLIDFFYRYEFSHAHND
jgi:lipoprotein signal peptidase